ncbi:hypothetical protein ACHAWU_006002 [Discostella pseudostelligera]|uniref:Thiamine phosphate synthase/TenI domain-containing protein n=1 Tax=Discostella pseudostelligera TaxID=259834 RepID=A0ABD3MKA0_9STRA
MMADLSLDHIHCLVLSIILCHALQSFHAATAFAAPQNDTRTKISIIDATILDRIQRAQASCNARGVHLWINDHWKAAIEAGGCFGIHLGQEDLAACIDAGDFELIRSSGLAFGISTHSYSELAAALGVKPSYISLGPVFKTSSKDVNFDPQGLETVRQWRSLMPPDIPLVAIGGIGNAQLAKSVREAGADCVAVIGAVTGAEDVDKAVDALNKAMS